MVGLARSGNDLNSGDSQFYICLNTLTHLDGKYVIFAKVTKGLEIIKNINKGTKIISARVEKNK
jgi:cyclophilin family peptidyl-prolyl cis-trans isomerase